jgi:hypothetical protein
MELIFENPSWPARHHYPMNDFTPLTSRPAFPGEPAGLRGERAEVVRHFTTLSLQLCRGHELPLGSAP